MGIPELAKWILRQKFYGVSIDTPPGGVDEMYIDFPGMIHDAAAVEIESSTKEERNFDESKFHMILESMIIEKVTFFSPSNLVYFAQDGMVPLAKIIQQRERRYDSAGGGVDSEREPEEKIENPEVVNKKSRFDRNSITPGTDFMERLSEKLKKWFSENKSIFPRLIYSPSSVAGEGEHKIYDFLRNRKFVPGSVNNDGTIRMNPNIVVVGMDADLILMSLINLEIPRIYLMRQNINFVLNIDALRERITSLLSDMKSAVQDFVLMVILMGGNDFLPKIEAFSDLVFGLDVMITTYNKMRLPLTTNISDINWPNLKQFLHRLTIMEQNTLLPVLSRRPYKYNSSLFDKSNFTEENIDTTSVYDKPLNRLVAPKKSFSFSTFRSLWYDKALRLRNLDRVSLSMLSNNPKSALTTKSTDVSSFLSDDILKLIAPRGHNLQEVISDMVRQYLTMVSWILAYFKGGYYSVNELYYKYHHAPLVSDIYHSFSTNVSGVRITFDKPQFSSLLSLPMVIPPQSSDKVRSEMKGIYRSKLMWMFPHTFTYDLIGRNQDFLKTKVIINPDINMIIDYVLDKVKIRKNDLHYYVEGKDIIYEKGEQSDNDLTYEICKLTSRGGKINISGENQRDGNLSQITPNEQGKNRSVVKMSMIQK